MENKALLWAKPDMVGMLLKRGGNVKSWKRRQFILKDAYLFYFKVQTSVEQSEPTGVIPLQGCKVGVFPCGADAAVQNVFIITLPEGLAGVGIIKRTNYALAASFNEEMHSWIDAIKLASFSKRKLHGKVDHAFMEVRDLEQRWAVAKERDAYRESGRGSLPMGDEGEEDPVILQALADNLMDAYHTREQLQNRIKEAQARIQEAFSHLTILERAASIQEEMIMGRKDLGRLMPEIQAEMASCSESLEWLIPVRFQFYTLERQVEALEGIVEGGEGVPSANELEDILRKTLKRLEDSEFQQRGDKTLPDETVISQLSAPVASISSEYMVILHRATESLQ